MNILILDMPSTMSSTLRRLSIPAVLAIAVDDAMSGPCSDDHTERLQCLYCLRCPLCVSSSGVPHKHHGSYLSKV